MNKKKERINFYCNSELLTNIDILISISDRYINRTELMIDLLQNYIKDNEKVLKGYFESQLNKLNDKGE